MFFHQQTTSPSHSSQSVPRTLGTRFPRSTPCVILHICKDRPPDTGSAQAGEQTQESILTAPAPRSRGSAWELLVSATSRDVSYFWVLPHPVVVTDVATAWRTQHHTQGTTCSDLINGFPCPTAIKGSPLLLPALLWLSTTRCLNL